MSGSSSRMQSKMEQARTLAEEEKLYRFRGILYPRVMCPEENLEALDGFQAREDDILLVAYPKCGFNWMVGVLKKIIYEATGLKTEEKVPPLIEFMGPEVLKMAAGAPSPRLLGTHLHPDNIPPSFYQKKTKMVVIFRNPKDTLVSFFHFSNKNPVLRNGQSWEDFYQDYMRGDVPWGSYFEHAEAWNKRMHDPNVKIVTFEELKKDLGEGVRQLSVFLGLELREEQVQSVAAETTFSAMKKSSGDSHGGLGDVFFRKGEVGDWKNHFTEEQSKQLDQVYISRLGGSQLEGRLNYHLYCQ